MAHLERREIKYGVSPSTASRSTAVSVETVRCRVRETSGDYDELLRQYIEEATDELERLTSRSFINRSHTLTLDHFPIYDDDDIRLPVAPVASVASISYINSSGTSVSWSTSKYDIDTTQEPARIRPAQGEDWPTTRDWTEQNSVTVTFTAGYGSVAADIPALARAAIANKSQAMFDGCGDANSMEAWSNAAALLKWDR